MVINKKIIEWLGCSAIVACWSFLYQSWLVGKSFIPWDAMEQIYPWMRFSVDTLKSGSLPFWNPYLFSGYPAVSDPQAHTFSVLALTLMALPGELTISWFNAIIVIHGLVGAIGVYFVARSYRMVPLAAIVGALVFLCGGVSAGRMQHVGMMLAYNYFPWAFFMLKRVMDDGRYRDAMGFGFFAGLMAIHGNHVAYLFSWILMGYVLYRLIETQGFWTYLRARVLVLILGGAIAFIILLPQLYATLLFLPHTNRPQIPFEVAAHLSLGPLAFLTLFIPDIFNNLTFKGYWGPNDPTESYLYIGVLPLVLLVRQGLMKGCLCDRTWLFFVIVAAFCFVYAIGAYTPIYKIMFDFMPGANLYRRPTDAAFPLNFALAILAAAMMHAVLDHRYEPSDRCLKWVHWFTLLLLIFFLIITSWALIRGFSIGEIYHITGKSLMAVLLFFAGFLLIRNLDQYRTGKGALVRNILVVSLIVVDYHHYSIPSKLNSSNLLQISYPYIENNTPLVEYLRTHTDLDGEQGGPFRVEPIIVPPDWCNGPAVFGIFSTQGYNPLFAVRYNQFRGVSDTIPSRKVPFFTDFIPNYQSRLFDLLGVKYILTQKNISELDPNVKEESFPLVATFDGLKIYENTDALPRVLLVRQAIVTSLDNLTKELMMKSDFDPSTTVILSNLPEELQKHNTSVMYNNALSIDLNSGVGGHARIIDYQSDKVQIDVDSTTDVFLVLNDPFFPGWQVYIDGKRSEILRANYLFRGVYVSAGRRNIVFQFRPFAAETIWYVLNTLRPERPRVFLSVNQNMLLPQENLIVDYVLQSAAPKNTPTFIDGWVAVEFPDGRFAFLNQDDTGFSFQEAPYRADLQVANLTGQLVSITVPDNIPPGIYTFYAVGVIPDTNPFDSGNWVTNLATQTVEILP